ncbi:MAG: hypothetical protein HZB46_10465 [Solirubrobacterales bacterium]|nr:hypothetical protein [Solirubrobacterales bacterium]
MSTQGRRPTTEDGRHALAYLQSNGPSWTSLADLRAEGVHMPAQAVYEVELAGWPIERDGQQVRLRPADVPPRKPAPMPPKVRLVPRDS